MKYHIELGEWHKGNDILDCSLSQLPKEFDGVSKKTSVINSVVKLQMLQKGMDPDSKSEIFPSPFKKKGDGKLKNGAKRSLADESPIPVKKKIKDSSPKEASNIKLPHNKTALASNLVKIPLNIAVKDSKFVDRSGKDSESEDMLEKMKTYFCKFCCKRFTNPQNLKVHLLTHQDNPVHECHICGLNVSTFSSLMSHYVRHSGIKMFGASEKSAPPKRKKPPVKRKTAILCTKCKKTFANEAVFGSHFCQPLNKKTEFVCTYCRKVTMTVEEYRDHIQSHSAAHFLCGHCSVRFETKSSLKEHFLICKKRPKTAIMPLSPKKVIPYPKRSSLSGLKFRKVKPKSEVPSATSIKIENEVSLSSDLSQQSESASKDEKEGEKPSESYTLVKVKEEPLSPLSDNDGACLDTFSVNGNTNRPARTRRKVRKVNVSVEPPAADGLPTRRSARLVNRKPVKFSAASSDSELEEKNVTIEALANGPKRHKSPTKSEEIVPTLEPTLIPKKNKSPKTPKKQKKLANIISLMPDNQEAATKIESTPIKESDEEQDSIKTLSDEVLRIQETIAKECQESISEIIFSPEIKKEKTSVKARKSPKSPVKNAKPKAEDLKKEPEQSKSDNNDNTESCLDDNKQMTLVCNQCSLVFRCKGSLKRHRKMHSGKPQFSCQYCGKFFFRKDIHKRHEMNVHFSDQDKVFICYYCKELFRETAALREHSYTVHAAKAMAPERIRRCTASSHAAVKKKDIKIEVNKEDVSVKEEGKENIKSEETKSVDSKDNLFNCGNCSVTFESPSTLVKHFNDVHSTSGNLKIIKVERDEDNSNIIKLENELAAPPAAAAVQHPETIVKKAPKSTTSIKTPKKSWSSPKKCQSMSSTTTSVTKSPKERKKNDPPHIVQPTEPADEPECMINVKQAINDKCSLNCAIAAEAEPHPCEDSFHKAIEWYQCQICTVSGPIAKMKDHMFKHMTKLGIFIVNSENKDFDNLTNEPFLDENGDAMVDSCDNNEELPNLSVLSNGIVETFIPSVVNPVNTLMSAVKCSRCAEEIIDFDILCNHPCLEKDGENSCFVQNCERGTLRDREEALNHFIESHFKPFYSDPRTEPDVDDSSDIESYSMHIGSPINDIFSEPPSEIPECK